MQTDKLKYALITGATSGIGLELAKLFAKNGYSLYILARYQEELDTTVLALETLGSPNVVALSKDLFNTEAALEVYREIKAAGITIDVLVNDAGQGLYGEFTETSLERELAIINLNIASLVILTKLFLQEMVNRGNGRILNVASIASKLPGPLQSVYHGTKAFVHSFTEAIREEVKDQGVSITSLLPGATDTDFFNKAEMNDAKVVQEGKLDDAEKVARDGYEALMAGKDMVVSGFKNKVQVAISNITPDEKVAEKLHKQQAPVTNKS